jgi:hypothetical protein
VLQLDGIVNGSAEDSAITDPQVRLHCAPVLPVLPVLGCSCDASRVPSLLLGAQGLLTLLLSDGRRELRGRVLGQGCPGAHCDQLLLRALWGRCICFSESAAMRTAETLLHFSLKA